MRMIKNKKIRRIVAFMLAIVLILGTMPYSVQNVKAAPVDFTIKITDDTDSSKVMDSAVVKFMQGTDEYIATYDDADNTYKLSVDDTKAPAGVFSYDSMEIVMDGYKTCIEGPDELLQTSAKEVSLTAKAAGMTANYAEASASVKYSDLTDGSYDVGAPTVEVPVDADAVLNQKITYAISGGNIADIDELKRASVDGNGLVTGLSYNADAYVITATVTSDNYADATATFTLTVDKGTHDAVFAEGDNVSVEYDNTTNPNTYTNVLTGVKEDAAVTYDIDTDTTGSATINEQTGEVSYTKSGSITVKAKVAGTDNYEEKEYVYTLAVDRQVRVDFAFASSDITFTYGENNNEFTQTVGGNGSDSAVYSVDKPDVAKIDAATGKLTILKAGTVVVTASVAETDTYASATANYTLVISKADREITFDDNAGVINITYNESEKYKNAAILSAGTDKVKYEITSDGVGIALVDNEGVVSYTGTGTVSVKASVSENDCYNACEASYTLNISYANISAVEDCVEIIGDKADDSNDWYKSNVTINAKTDYQLKKEQSDTSWLDNIPLATDGIYNAYQLYVKNSSDEIGLITLPEIRIDTTAPVCSAVQYETPAYEKVLEMITFGFYKASTVVMLEATDEGTDISGIKNITYTITKDDGTEETKTVAGDIAYDENGQKMTYSLTVSSAYKNRIKFSASDNAGNSSDSAEDNRGVYIDREAPVISYTFPAEQCIVDADDKVVEEAGSDTRYVYNSAVRGTITVSDIIIDIDTVSVVIKKDGVKVSTLGASDFNDTLGGEETYTGVYDFDTDGVYEATTTVSDKLGNESSSVYRLVVDKAASVIDVKYNQDDVQSWYTSDVTATIKITDENLRLSAVKAAITAKDSLGAEFSDLTVKVYNNSTAKEDEIKVSEFADAITNEAYWVKAGNTWTAVVNYSNDASYKFTMECSDIAYNKSDIVNEFTLDKTKPEISVTLSDSSNDEVEGVLYYGADKTASADIVIKDEHFDANKIRVTDTQNGTDVTLNQIWTQVQDDTGAVTNSWKTTIVFTQEGGHRLTVEGSDAYGNVMDTYVSDKLIKDNTKPVISVANGTTNFAQTVENSNYYNGSRTDTITIKENNFDPKKVSIKVTALDYNGKVMDVTNYNEILQDEKKWTKTTDIDNTSIYTANITFDKNANYTYTINCTDLAKQAADEYPSDSFTVDNEAPEVVNIVYKPTVLEQVFKILTFNKVEYIFSDNTVDVTITVKDSISGIEKLEYSVLDDNDEEKYIIEKTLVVSGDPGFERNEDTVTYTFPVKPQARGNVYVTAYDYSKKSSDEKDENVKDEKVIIVDNISPKVSIEYSENLTDKVISDKEGNITRKHVEDGYENQDTRYVYSGEVTATVIVDEENFFVTENDVIFTVTRDGEEITDYIISPEWTTDVDGKYNRVLTFRDDGDYQLKITYSDKSENPMDYEGENSSNVGTGVYTSNIFTIDKTSPEINVSYDVNKDGNLYNKDRTATITIKDRNFRPYEVNVMITSKDKDDNTIAYTAPDLTKWVNWKQSDDDENTWEAYITYDSNAVYTFDIEYQDIAKNALKEDYIQDEFSISKNAPSGLEIVEYSEPVITIWDTMLEMATFGKYHVYKDSVTVTVKVVDTDNVAGIKQIDWEYNKESGVSDINKDKLTGTINNEALTVSGNVVTGKFTLPSEAADDQLRGNITFTATSNTDVSSVKKEDTEAGIIVDGKKPVGSVEYLPSEPKTDDNDTKYYDGDVTAHITIDEANFYGKNVHVYVNDEEVHPVWSTAEEDKHNTDVVLSGDGDYVIKMTYIDHSGNKMDAYTSSKIVIDTVNPVLDITYDNKNVINKVDGNDYFDSNQSAEIKITEHNFRAEDVVVDVKATDVNGNSINVQNYADYLKRESSWTTSGDVHTAKITFDVNANYIVQADFTDLAKREVSSDTDYFTVDKVNPYGLSISYSASVLDTILEAVTFGFYNTPVEVAVEASDDISPVERFEYAYDKSSGASDTNVQQINDIVRNAEISRDGSRSTTSFVIPKGTLMAGNQINGTMSFVAYDYAGNNSDLDDNEVIIVDNINPQAMVTFNEPVQNYNGIAYYAGDIQATVVIEEANFYPEDVEILVTKDGNTQAVEASWSDNSADVHTGTFTLHEDGDYQVAVNYMDKSQNAMAAYTSEQMTIDTQLPAVSVSNIKSNSANKDEIYSFTITASDENFDTAGFVPELRAVLRNEAGNYTTQEISLGTIKAVDEGRTYAFTVDNLTQDAVYNLTCTVRDLSGNEYRGVLLEDGQEYENVAFSINRNGSTFSVNENTEKLLDNYYVYEVGQDVVIYEVNIDPIQTYVVKLNGKELKEGSDYTTSMTNNAGEWAVRKYTINKALFETEGEYKIIIESVDKTNTSAYSDVKNLTVAYVVDKTAPLLTVSGLENGGRYQIGEQEVTVLATDDGGRLKSFKAVVLDSEGNAITDENGNDVSVRYDMSGDDLLDYLSSSDGKITFTVPEGLEQQVVLTCDDAAVGLDGTTNKTEERFSKVTVSQSGLIILYANKPLFYGIIAGAVLLMAAGVGLVIFVGRKKAKSNN